MPSLSDTPRPPADDPAAIRATYRAAVADWQAGRLTDAAAGFDAVLAARPGLAEALYHRARIDAARGEDRAARARFEAALAAKPAEPALWLALCDHLRGVGDGAALSALLRRARAASLPAPLQAQLAARAAGRRPGPRDPGRAGAAAAMALLRAGDAAGAARRAAAEAGAHPASAAAQAVLGAALATLDRPAEAEPALRQALARDPGDADSAANLADLLLRAGRLPEAAEVLAPAVAAAPAHARARALYGRALAGLDRPDEAEAQLLAALKHAPGDARALAFLGALLVRQERHAEALAPLRAALDAGVTGPRVWLDHGKALGGAGQPAEAMAAFAAALAADPDFAEAFAARAMVHLQQGDFAAARTDFDAAIARAPQTGAFYRMAAAGQRLTPGDPLIARMEEAWARTDLPLEARAELGFALAKAMDDTGQTDRVFGYLDIANGITRARWPYDPGRDANGMRQVCAAFARAPKAPPEGDRGSGPAPIFVTGLPRSGTTLVEQILASHSQVTGAGELALFTACLSAHLGALTSPEGPPDAVFVETGRAYTAALAARFPGAARVVDKSIATFQAIGHVPLALPRAKVVLVRRDPRDVGLSIYRNRFPEGRHRYAADLRDIGRYARLFDEVAAFWRTAAPGAFHEIVYEELIADPEAQTRALVAACGLDWEDACLSFHRTRRRVATLSVYQVRQPIYRSAVQGWRKYAAELAPLFAALAEDAPLLFPR
jgi:tetratricopeptide (TPR) repeat protein